MTWLAVVMAFGFGFMLGRATRTEEPMYEERPQMIEDEEVVERAEKDWKPRMSPARYLRLHPDGPYAEQARLIVSNHSLEA